MRALNPKHGIKEYHITGELVYCITNHAEYDVLLNDEQFQDRIVIVERGKVPLLEKIYRDHSTIIRSIIARYSKKKIESLKKRGANIIRIIAPLD